MANINITDEWLYKYMPLVDDALIQELERTSDYKYEFSEQFMSKMQKLQKKECHIAAWNRFKYFRKSVAIFILAILIPLLVLTINVEAIRNVFFEKIKTVLEDSYIYSFFTGDNNTTLENITPNYVPDGYDIIFEERNESLQTIIYANTNGDMISFNRMSIVDGSKITFDLEYVDEDIIEHGNSTISIYWYEDESCYAYCEYMKNIFILSADNINRDEIEKIYSNWIR